MLHTHFFLLAPIVKDVALADDLKVRLHATLLQIRNRDHSDFVNLLHNRSIRNGLLYVRPADPL